MLQNTFLHIPGINKTGETEIWKNNVYSWNEFLENHHKVNIKRKEHVCQYIEKSLQAHQDQNHNFFINDLPSNEHWRVYRDFKCCFLDIETTGLSKHRNDLTMVGLYDGNESKVFVNGKNLHLFPEEISKYQTIITYNGKCFDLPFLHAKFPKINFSQFHIDLRYPLRDLGYMGGLKRIEKEVGIQRDDDLQDVDGYEAVRLWYKYKRGDEKALDLLTKYNIADVENLKVLMDFAFNKLKHKHFLSKIE